MNTLCPVVFVAQELYLPYVMALLPISRTASLNALDNSQSRELNFSNLFFIGVDYSGINVPLVAVCNVPPVAQCNVPPQKWLQ